MGRSVGTRRLLSTRVAGGVARFGDCPATGGLAAGVLPRDSTAVAHDLTGLGEAGQLAYLGNDGDGSHLSYAAKGLESLDDLPQDRRGQFDGLVQSRLQSLDALSLMIDLGQVVFQGGA